MFGLFRRHQINIQAISNELEEKIMDYLKSDDFKKEVEWKVARFMEEPFFLNSIMSQNPYFLELVVKKLNKLQLAKGGN